MEAENDGKSEDIAADAPSVPQARSKGFLRSSINRNTGTNTLGRQAGIPQRRVTFLVDRDACCPGVFAQDFELTLRGTTAEMELMAAKGARGDAVAMTMALARSALCEVNGEPIDTGNLEHEWLWEALGTGGRNMVLGIFAQYCTADEASQGKAMRSIRVEN